DRLRSGRLRIHLTSVRRPGLHPVHLAVHWSLDLAVYWSLDLAVRRPLRSTPKGRPRRGLNRADRRVAHHRGRLLPAYLADLIRRQRTALILLNHLLPRLERDSGRRYGGSGDYLA